jgi:hypothetical protein
MGQFMKRILCAFCFLASLRDSDCTTVNVSALVCVGSADWLRFWWRKRVDGVFSLTVFTFARPLDDSLTGCTSLLHVYCNRCM